MSPSIDAVEVKLRLDLDLTTMVHVYHPPPGITWAEPGEDDDPEDFPAVAGRVVSIGELIAEKLAATMIAGLDQHAYLVTAEHLLDDAITANAARLVAGALARKRGTFGRAREPELTLHQLIAREIDQQANKVSPTAMARGRPASTTLEAIIAVCVTEELRQLTGVQVAMIRAKILADIAATGGAG